MKGAVRGLIILNYVWLVIVFILIFFAALPIIPGMVVIEPPGSDGWTTTITNDTVTITGNVSIRNGGFFPFNNFFFAINLYADNGTLLASASSTKMNLLPGLWMDVPITFFIDKSQISESVLEALLRSEVTFGSLVYFNLNYLFDFRIQAGIKGNITVGPLIKDLFVDWDNTLVVVNGTEYEMNIPYSFNSSSVWMGSQLSVSGSVSNSTMALGSVSTNVTLGGRVESTLVIKLSEEAYNHLSTSPDHLILNLTIKLNDVTWDSTQEYDWVPRTEGGT